MPSHSAHRSRTIEASLLLAAVFICTASACSEEGETARCTEQPLFNIAKEYRELDGSAEPGNQAVRNARTVAEEEGCISPVGHATSVGGTSSTGGSSGAAGSGGSNAIGGSSASGAGGETAGSAGSAESGASGAP